jgi:hypothetical protein
VAPPLPADLAPALVVLATTTGFFGVDGAVGAVVGATRGAFTIGLLGAGFVALAGGEGAAEACGGSTGSAGFAETEAAGSGWAWTTPTTNADATVAATTS